MRADNSRFIVEAAKGRRAETLSRAQTVIAHALKAGEPTTVSAIAAAANVSRSWLYAEPGLREDLTRLTITSVAGRRPAKVIKSAHPASEASLRTRLEVALERARRLETENRHLRDQLATALGQRRRDRIIADSHLPTNEPA